MKRLSAQDAAAPFVRARNTPPPRSAAHEFFQSRLRNRLMLVFLAATLAPIALTLWASILLERSLDIAPVREVDELSKSLERVGRKLYQRSCESLKTDASLGRVAPTSYAVADKKHWPSDVAEFWEGGQPEWFSLAGNSGDRLDYFVRHGNEVLRYSGAMGGIGMDVLSRQYAHSRKLVDRAHDLRRGFIYAVISLSGVIWLASMAVVLFWAHRISRPIQQLTDGLAAVAAGNFSARVTVQGNDEIASAIQAFNRMADQLQRSRERLIHVTRLASWQAVARKMAHEVKNSLTPIRLTMEEIVARYGTDSGFLEQAAQIVIDEVTSLERRVRAFSEFAAEPPVSPAGLDVNALVDERLAFLKSAHPEVIYSTRLASGNPEAFADPDLIKGVLTNLFENAAEAARAGGVVLASTRVDGDRVHIEIHDSGPGLSLHARGSLFEPTISFKKGGMGLGLSIAHKSALLCGGDLAPIDGELGGAAFRLTLPCVASSEPVEQHQPVGAAYGCE